MGRVFKALSKAESTNTNIVTPEMPATTAPVASPETQLSELPTKPHQADPEPTVTESNASEQASVFREDNSGASMTARSWDERLVAASGSDMDISEEFRRLRTRILHPPEGGNPPRTILVASVAPGEGKTFVCSGLAISLAQGVGAHALMIDCDLRRPALAGVFGIGNEPGLSDHLRDKTGLDQLIRKTGLHKLSLIASGRPPTNPAELLGSEMLTAMINEVAGRYPDRYILFDSPPLLKAAETAILAKLVDGVVLVVREGKSRREDTRLFIDTIGPEKIIGVVFNGYRSNILERRLSGAYGGAYYSSYGLQPGDGG